MSPDVARWGTFIRGASGDAMTDYLFRLEVPADKRSFTVAEALGATSEAIHPDHGTGQPVMIASINKVAHLASRPTVLEEADWRVLRVIWSGMDEPEFPMTLAEWQPYLDAFNSSPNRPEGWGLSALQRDPEFQTMFMRGITLDEHRDILKRAVNSGAVALRNPVTGIPSELGWVGDADKWLLTRSHLRKLCDLLAIELVDAAPAVPHFITSTRPVTVPPELLALAADARITYEHSIAGQRGSGMTNAGDYREVMRETIARQAEGYFTLNEAAQVLADSRPGLDPMDTVKRFRLAHAKGELPIHHGRSRFPLEVGETIRDFLDLLEEAELDAWLRASAGYGFPGAGSPDDAKEAPTTAQRAPALDRGRRVKRAALIADNMHRWPTIERDLKDAAANGLSDDAKDSSEIGWWWEGSAIAWARARAKVQDAGPGLAGVTGTIHRMGR